MANSKQIHRPGRNAGKGEGAQRQRIRLAAKAQANAAFYAAIPPASAFPLAKEAR